MLASATLKPMRADMIFVGPNSRKINKAATIAEMGRYPSSFRAMLDAIPVDVISTLTAKQLAALIDANWRLGQRSKRIAEDEACASGVVWDHKHNRPRELAS